MSKKGYFTAKDKNGNKYYIYNTDERYLSGELIPECTGRKHTEETKKKISESAKKLGNKLKPSLGKKWVHKGTENLIINPEQMQEYLDKGYVLGCYKKPSEKKKKEIKIEDIYNFYSPDGLIAIEFKKENLDNLVNVPGIYAIHNKVNNKYYIGQAKYLKRRLNAHYYNFYRGVRKYPIYIKHLKNMVWNILN